MYSSASSVIFFCGRCHSFPKASAFVASKTDATVAATHKAHVATFVCTWLQILTLCKRLPFLVNLFFLSCAVCFCSVVRKRAQSLDFCPQHQASLLLISVRMASPEDVIEPAIQSSAAQTVSRRRFSNDLHNLSPDELDGLMSSSGKRNSPCCEYMCMLSLFYQLSHQVNSKRDIKISSYWQMVVLFLWCIIFLSSKSKVSLT